MSVRLGYKIAVECDDCHVVHEESAWLDADDEGDVADYALQRIGQAGWLGCDCTSPDWRCYCPSCRTAHGAICPDCGYVNCRCTKWTGVYWNCDRNLTGRAIGKEEYERGAGQNHRQTDPRARFRRGGSRRMGEKP